MRNLFDLHWLQSGERVVFQPFSSFTAGCGDYLSAVLHLKIQKPPPQHIHKLSHPHPPIIVKTLFFSFFILFHQKVLIKYFLSNFILFHQNILIKYFFK